MPALVQRMVLHAIDIDIQFAVHTSVNRLPGNCPGSVVTYYQRPLRIRRAMAAGAASLEKWVTMTDMHLAFDVEDQFDAELRIVALSHVLVAEAYHVYAAYIGQFSVAPVVNLDEFRHRYLHSPPLTYTYVVQRQVPTTQPGATPTLRIVGCFCYYTLRQTRTASASEPGLKIAMSLFNARYPTTSSAEAFRLSSESLLRCVLYQAHKDGVDVFYCLNNADNPAGFRQTLFHRCDSDELYYYFYNVRLNALVPPSELGLSLP